MSMNTQDYGDNIAGGQPGFGMLESTPAMPAQVAETKEVTPAGIANQSDIKKSTSLPMVIDPVASQPSLLISFPNSSPYSKAKGAISSEAFSSQTEALEKMALYFQVQQEQIAQAMLDAWSESVQQQAKISKEASLESDRIEEILKSQRMVQEIINEKVENREEPSVWKLAVFRDGDFTKYWAQAPYQEKLQIADSFNTLITERMNNPAGQLDDVRKVIGPHAAAVVTTAFISEVLSTNYAGQVAAQSIQSIVPSSLDINLLVPLYSLTAETSLTVRKTLEGEPAKSKRQFDMEFVHTFAQRAKSRIDALMNVIGDPQRGLGAAQSALVWIAAALQLDIKSQAAASNLSREELNSLLSLGYPGNDVLNALLGDMNHIINILANHPNGSIVLANFNDFMNKLPGIRFDRLKEMYEALLRAHTVIGTDKRIASEAS